MQVSQGRLLQNRLKVLLARFTRAQSILIVMTMLQLHQKAGLVLSCKLSSPVLISWFTRFKRLLQIRTF